MWECVRVFFVLRRVYVWVSLCVGVSEINGVVLCVFCVYGMCVCL